VVTDEEREHAWGAVHDALAQMPGWAVGPCVYHGDRAPPKGTVGFTPLAPLYKVEHAFAQLGRWRRLARCDEGTAASACAWLEVASFGYLLGRVQTRCRRLRRRPPRVANVRLAFLIV